jgi:hypothetical protein
LCCDTNESILTSFIIVNEYFTLGHVGGGNSCGGYTLMRVAVTLWVMGLWSTQAKVESIVLKDAWHWVRDSSVNDPFGEPGRTPSYVGHPPAWGSVDSDLMFFLYVCMKEGFLGTPADIHE